MWATPADGSMDKVPLGRGQQGDVLEEEARRRRIRRRKRRRRR